MKHAPRRSMRRLSRLPTEAVAREIGNLAGQITCVVVPRSKVTRDLCFSARLYRQIPCIAYHGPVEDNFDGLLEDLSSPYCSGIVELFLRR
jgi:phage-related protein